MANNVTIARSAVSLLATAGVDTAVICSGNRNTPLIGVFSSQNEIELYNHFSEAAASFFALGIAKRKQRPVAVVVTSGTAAVQLAAAMTEAYYSGVPLIAITADRPKRYRGSGAPQSINQKNLFGETAISCFDIDSVNDFPPIDELASLLREIGPVHLNLCFEEPLIDGELGEWRPEILDVQREFELSNAETENFQSFLRDCHAPLAIVGELPAHVREAVAEFLLRTNIPSYLESLSGIREVSKLKSLVLDDPWKAECDAIIRFGSIPTTGIWRDLERNDQYSNLPVCSLSDQQFSGLARGSLLLPLSQIDFDAISVTYAEQQLPNEKGQELPLEASFFRRLSEVIEDDAFVYLGNSRPIRYWDSFAERKPNSRMFGANRGVNGIDGQLSTFIGMAHQGRANWCITGDLTLLYDLEAGFMLEQLSNIDTLRFVVINNNGGRLFEALPDFRNHFKGTNGERFYIQPQIAKLSAFADLWGLDYLQITEPTQLNDELPKRVLIEILSSEER